MMVACMLCMLYTLCTRQAQKQWCFYFLNFLFFQLFVFIYTLQKHRKRLCFLCHCLWIEFEIHKLNNKNQKVKIKQGQARPGRILLFIYIYIYISLLSLLLNIIGFKDQKQKRFYYASLFFMYKYQRHLFFLEFNYLKKSYLPKL